MKMTFFRLLALTLLFPCLNPLAEARKESYHLSESTLLPRTLNYIRENYVEPSRIDPKEMFTGAMKLLQKSIPEILFESDSSGDMVLTIDKASKKFSSSLGNLDDLWKLMREIFVFIELNYQGEVELSDIESILINGLLSTLDPHSAFLTPEVFKEFQIDTGGQFGGLGIVITSKDGQLTVITPIEDTPAWKAGIQSGDVILQIGDESTINMPLTSAVEKLRGKIGSQVTIVVERKGRSAPFKVGLTRANIEIGSIKSTVIKEADGNVGYIKLSRFQKETFEDFYKHLKNLETQAGPNFKGLIIDMRNNPGGLLDQAVKIADTFLAKGVIVSTVGANPKFNDEDEAHFLGTEPENYPIVVLINEGAASASEIVAGALQAYGRALLVGRKTFGKGSVQNVAELGDKYALKLTVAQYLTAGKYSIQTVGITPDILVEPVSIDKKSVDIDPNKSSSEMELEKHLEQIKPLESHDKITVRFFKPYSDENETEEKKRREYLSKLEFKDDFEVKLATRIILASSVPRPKEMMEGSKEVLKTLEQQENEKIAASLQENGTNWTPGEAVASANIDVTYHVLKKGRPVGKTSAGDEVELVLNVTNLNPKPLPQILALMESEHSLLNEKEFAFGKLAPKESASRKVTIKLPSTLPDINIPFKVRFKSGGGMLPREFKSSLAVQGLTRPRFAVNYQLEKPETVEITHPLPRGKSVPFSVKVTNTGQGEALDTFVAISNKKNGETIFIEKGRLALGKIKPGETKKAVLAFKVPPALPSSTFPLELSVTDKETMEFLTTDIEVTMESGRMAPPAGVQHQGPTITPAEKTFPVVSPNDTYEIKGQISDDQAVKDYYIFVNDEKVTYQSFPSENNSTKFSKTVKLKKGNNNVTIVARDKNELASVESFIVQNGNF